MKNKLLFTTDKNQAKYLSKLHQQKRLQRIYHGIYTDNLVDSIEEIAKRNWMDIVSHLIPGGILSFRSALDLKLIPFKGQFIVFVTSSYAKIHQLPGFIINVIQGNKDDFLEQILPNLARSNVPRFLLENLSTVRKSEYKNVKTVSDEGVENYLVKELHSGGEERLNQIRDEAKVIAPHLNYTREYDRLNQIISALLSTHPDTNLLKTRSGQAVSKKELYDTDRLKSFERLTVYLKKCNFLTREYKYQKSSYKNISFFESYFSNFIEGTEFVIDEAEDIVFKGVEIYSRHADSHDVLSNFNLTYDFSEMNRTPQSADEFIELLTARHAYLMQERPEINPGQFKTLPNKAGNTYFVTPKYVEGTLRQGFKLYKILTPGMDRALFMHFLISEVHPFSDGNGRISRIMMNAEFVSSELYKIIIPTVHRDNYLNGLRLASRDQNFHLYCKIMDQAQAYTASINWADYGTAREKLEFDCADQIADEGIPFFNRALRQLTLSPLPPPSA